MSSARVAAVTEWLAPPPPPKPVGPTPEELAAIEAAKNRAAKEEAADLEAAAAAKAAAEAEALRIAAEEAAAKEQQMDDREYQRQLRQYVTQVMRKVFGKVKYPQRAIKYEWQGKVELLATMDENGKLIDVDIDSSSGYKGLDEAATKAVRKAAPFPELTEVARQELAAEDGNSYVMSIPVTFRLSE